jgi:hypothetical protein
MVRVERKVSTIQLRSRSVAKVAQNGMPSVSELDANLVPPAGVQSYLHEARIARCDALPLQHGALGIGIIGRGYPHGAIVTHQIIFPPTHSGQSPFHQSQIPFGDGTLTELTAQVPGGRRRASQHHQAGGRTVEPVYQAEERICRSYSLAGKPCFGKSQHIRVARGVCL